MKIVVTGPFAAGKTTLISTISEIAVLSTERAVSDSERPRKAGTTVAMDFGRITIDRDLVLYMFGTPGQARFDFMWEILGEGMLGFVLLLDGREDLAAAKPILDAFRAQSTVPYVVACDFVETADAPAVREVLGLDADVPVLACDATDRESVKSVLLALLYALAARIEPSLARAE